jgi:glycosyltransferase involved in cell wall biosynthesis
MRVVHVVPALFSADGGVIGGAERYALELSRSMAREVPTTLVSFGKEDRAEQIDGLQIKVIGNPWYVKGQRANPVAFRPLLSMLRTADVVHCHQQHIVSSSLAAVICRLTGRRVFVSDLGGGGWDISGYISTDDWYHGHLHISEYSRRVFKHTASSKAHVILGGVDTRKFCPDNSVSKNGTVLYVGRLLPHKGVNYLIEALPPNMSLELVGQPYDREFLAYLRELAAGKNVVFRHECDDAELLNAYRRAFCVVLPSVYKTVYGTSSAVPELLGQTLLEGMACGIPAICTDVASMPEVVADGVSGFVVPPNDPLSLRKKLIWLHDHPAEAREMGLLALRRIESMFTWPRVVQRCLEIYQA